MGGCVGRSDSQNAGSDSKETGTLSVKSISNGIKKHPEFAAVHVGMNFYCLDEFQSKYTAEPMARWRAAVIREIDHSLVRILVHFDGWKDRHDIWLKLKEDIYRICPEEVLTEDQMKDGAPLDDVQHQVSRYYLAHGTIPPKYYQLINRDSLMSQKSHQGTQHYKLGQKVTNSINVIPSNTLCHAIMHNRLMFVTFTSPKIRTALCINGARLK
jgi:hypothetical protein